MQKGFKPLIAQKQIQERLINTQQKARCFFEMYSNKEQVHAAMNAFQLLPAQQILKIIESFGQMFHYDLNRQTQGELFQCYQYCRNFQTNLNRVDKQINNRKDHTMLILILVSFCSLTVCTYALVDTICWFIFSGVFRGNVIIPDQVCKNTFVQQEQSTVIAYMTYVKLYIIGRLITGLLAIPAVLFIAYVISLYAPGYFRSFQLQWSEKKLFKERLERNRQASNVLRIN